MSGIQRRDFLKIIGAGAAGAGAGFLVKESSKNRPEQYIPYVVTPEDYTPGVANYFRTVCTQCPSGCGVEVRVLEGRAKKIEGNPLHPVSQGKSCALGQSSLNALYNPDRLRQPQQRRGDRGSGKVAPISWEQAFTTVAGKLAAARQTGKGANVALLSGSVRGHLHELLEHFMAGLGSDHYLQYDFSRAQNLYDANRASYGHDELPYYDIHNADLLVSFGADYLSTWLSPVHHGLGYGHLRQGEGRSRGHVVQVEPRMSLSGAKADHWLPARPGSEGLIALAIANTIKPDASLAAYTVERAAQASGLEASVIADLAARFASASLPLAIAGGPAANATNGMANVVAVNLLNSVANSALVGNPVAAIGAEASARRASHADMMSLIHAMKNGDIEILIIHDTNPIYSMPAAAGLREAIDKVPFVVALSPFVDETSAMADLILAPDSALESWFDDTPSPGIGLAAASIAQPVVSRIHDTRAIGDIILELGSRIGNDIATRLPWSDTEAFLRARWQELYQARAGAMDGMSFDEFFQKVLIAGVWAERAPVQSLTISGAALDPGEPDQPGEEYPFFFTPYLSNAFLDGRGANLPWQQEMPDPLTGVVYDSWAEINPATAEKLGLRDGDVVEVESASGSVRAAVVTYPAIRPDVIGMPVGQGHTAFGRYASGRGANPLSIVNPQVDKDSGALAWGGTHVRLTPTGERVRLTRMSGTPRELGRSILGPYGEGGKIDPHADDEHHG